MAIQDWFTQISFDKNIHNVDISFLRCIIYDSIIIGEDDRKIEDWRSLKEILLLERDEVEAHNGNMLLFLNKSR
jgi:hypothetical protein